MTPVHYLDPHTKHHQDAHLMAPSDYPGIVSRELIPLEAA